MLRAFSSAVSGMRSQMAFMDVVANNIANVNTTAFKAARARFADMLYQTLNGGSAEINPTQIGLGTRLAGVDTIMTQGALRTTGNPLDLAIEGDGFFILKDANGNTFYTRDGSFIINSNGDLVHAGTGMKVQDDSGGGDALTGFDPTQYSSVSIGPDGKIMATPAAGGAPTQIGQIGLATFKNPEGLLHAGDNLWRESASSGTANPTAPQQNGAGSLRSGVLESSNVDLAQEFANMIAAQRGFQANSRVITASDEILQDLVNIKR